MKRRLVTSLVCAVGAVGLSLSTPADVASAHRIGARTSPALSCDVTANLVRGSSVTGVSVNTAASATAPDAVRTWRSTLGPNPHGTGARRGRHPHLDAGEVRLTPRSTRARSAQAGGAQQGLEVAEQGG